MFIFIKGYRTLPTFCEKNISLERGQNSKIRHVFIFSIRAIFKEKKRSDCFFQIAFFDNLLVNGIRTGGELAKIWVCTRLAKIETDSTLAKTS